MSPCWDPAAPKVTSLECAVIAQPFHELAGGQLQFEVIEFLTIQWSRWTSSVKTGCSVRIYRGWNATELNSLVLYILRNCCWCCVVKGIFISINILVSLNHIHACYFIQWVTTGYGPINARSFMIGHCTSAWFNPMVAYDWPLPFASVACIWNCTKIVSDKSTHRSMMYSTIFVLNNPLFTLVYLS